MQIQITPRRVIEEEIEESRRKTSSLLSKW